MHFGGQETSIIVALFAFSIALSKSSLPSFLTIPILCRPRFTTLITSSTGFIHEWQGAVLPTTSRSRFIRQKREKQTDMLANDLGCHNIIGLKFESVHVEVFMDSILITVIQYHNSSKFSGMSISKETLGTTEKVVITKYFAHQQQLFVHAPHLTHWSTNRKSAHYTALHKPSHKSWMNKYCFFLSEGANSSTHTISSTCFHIIPSFSLHKSLEGQRLWAKFCQQQKCSQKCGEEPFSHSVI